MNHPMTTSKTIAPAALAGLLLACACRCASAAPPAPGPIVPQPIPAGFDYPLPAATIDGWIARADTAAMRRHAWNLWAGLASPSGQVERGQVLPVWETWFGQEEVFTRPSPGAGAAGGLHLMALAASPRRTLRAFVRPNQFDHAAPDGAAELAPALGGRPPVQVVSFNKFNDAAATFVRAQHPGPDGKLYDYHVKASLRALNAAWPAGTAGEARAIAEFPVEAMELKPVMRVVHAQGLTPQPLWQGPAASTDPANPTPETWTTCVLVDPSGNGPLRPATAAEAARARAEAGACSTFLYGPLALFYSFRMDASEAAAFTAAQGGAAKAGDFAVLVAMHVNTKEIPSWTWQTFWWQPGADTPDAFPGSKAGQPATVTAPWSNYAACANDDQTTTPGGDTMQVCFNPYLETSPGIPSGLSSNCMGCHGVARLRADVRQAMYPPAYAAPIRFFTDPAYFNDTTTHLDFSWAIPNAR